MWKKIFYPTFFKQIWRKKIKILQIFVVIFVKITFFKKQKRHSIEDSKTNMFVPESTPEALQCTPFTPLWAIISQEWIDIFT